MKVSIGRIVHVVNVVKTQRKTLPAIVVAVADDQSVDVQMFSDRHAGHSFLPAVCHESTDAPDPLHDMFWTWPPRES